MTKTMYDSINPDAIPRTAEMVAGYVNGSVSKWPPQAWGHWPRVKEVHIDVVGDYAFDADVLDIERGAANLSHARAWIEERVKHGRACLYFSRSLMADVAREVAGFPAVDVWVADWTGEPHAVEVPAGLHLVAVQYKNTPNFDLSVVFDPHWPWGEKRF